MGAPLRGRLHTNKPASSASIEVLRLVPETTHLQLCVDFQLVTDGATLWLTGSKIRGWKRKQGQPIQNTDLWQELHDLLQCRRAEAKWVKAPSHVDLEETEKADAVADE